MASVQMSQTLRDQITDNYRQQLYTAYRKVHNVQPAIDTILQGILDNDPEFAALCAVQKEFGESLKTLRKRYNTHSYYSNGRVCEEIVSTSNELGLVCNPLRPPEENGTYITEWYETYKDEYSSDDKMRPASETWRCGDVAVKLTDLQPFYAPIKLSIEYERGWQQKQFAPHVNGTAIIITDPELCKQLSPIGEIETKVGQDVETFKDYISKITTLKRFIDEWPGGKDLVPDEYMQRMLAKKKPTQANRMTPDQIIPDELKEQMNEVILTNKLLGGNND